MRSRAESDARLRSLESAMRVGGLDDAQIDKYFSDMMTKEEMLPYIEGAEQQGYRRCKREMLPYIEGAEQQGYLRCKREMLPYIEGAEQQGYNRGLEEGRAEGIAQIAKSLLSMGQSKEVVSKATGLTMGQIDDLVQVK